MQTAAREEKLLPPIETLARKSGAQAARDAEHSLSISRRARPNRQSKRFAFLAAAAVLAFAVVGFIAYQKYFRKPEARTTLANRIAPFSGLPGREDMPAFSPDGKQMAFAWNGGDEANNFDVYVKIIGAGELVRLTNDARSDIYPKFSPDGKTIAFVRDSSDYGEVFLIPALGGAGRRVCKTFAGFTSISFSPDGKTLAVIDTEDSTLGKRYAVYFVNLQTGDGSDIFVVPADAVGEPRRVTDTGRSGGKNILPSWSADGLSVYFA